MCKILHEGEGMADIECRDGQSCVNWLGFFLQKVLTFHKRKFGHIMSGKMSGKHKEYSYHYAFHILS